MASIDLSVGDHVKIDGKGEGIVKRARYEDGQLVFGVEIIGIDMEFEFNRNRLIRICEESTENVAKQTTRPAIRPAELPSSSTTSKSTRFCVVTDREVDDFNDKQTNRNTMRKTAADLNILREFCLDASVNEMREIHQIPPSVLCALLCRFFVSVRKVDGNEYEPSCLRGMLSIFDRQLRRQ